MQGHARVAREKAERREMLVRQVGEKCSRGHLPSPLARYAREREREHELTRAGKCGKRRGNQISKEHQVQTLIKEKRANYRKQMKSRVRHLI